MWRLICNPRDTTRSSVGEKRKFETQVRDKEKITVNERKEKLTEQNSEK